MIVVGADGGCLDMFSLVCHFSLFLPPSGRRPYIDLILSQRAIKPKSTNKFTKNDNGICYDLCLDVT